MAGAAHAQQATPAQPMQIFPPAVPTPPKGEARITVTYNTNDKLPRDPDAGTLLVAQSKAHRTIYEIAAQECKVLLETIAAECRVLTVTVSSNVQQRAAGAGGATEPWLLTNGSSTFLIKPKDDGKD